MNDLSPARAVPPDETWRLFNVDEGFMTLIGPLWFKRDGDAILFGFRVASQHLNRNGVVHGGMLMTFIDQIIGTHVWRVTDKKPSVTVSLTTDFLASARDGDWVEARTEVSRRGAGLVFMRGEVSSGGRKLVAAQGIWKLIERK